VNIKPANEHGFSLEAEVLLRDSAYAAGMSFRERFSATKIMALKLKHSSNNTCTGFLLTPDVHVTSVSS
jgi:hypothetical protein